MSEKSTCKSCGKSFVFFKFAPVKGVFCPYCQHKVSLQ